MSFPMMNRPSRAVLLAAAALLSTALVQSAAAIPVNFSEPGAWSVGNVGSTYQQWLAESGANPITTNLDHNANPSTGTPTLGVAGGFVASSGGLYSFSGPYTVTATIPATGTAGPGTHIVVQTGATLNPDYQPENDATGGSVIRESLQVLDSSNNVLATSAAVDVTRTYYNPAMDSSFGEVQYEELIWEVYLPGFTGDFQVVFDTFVHSSVQVLRIDSSVAAVPEPATLALLGTGLASVVALAARRRRSTR